MASSVWSFFAFITQGQVFIFHSLLLLHSLRLQKRDHESRRHEPLQHKPLGRLFIPSFVGVGLQFTMQVWKRQNFDTLREMAGRRQGETEADRLGSKKKQNMFHNQTKHKISNLHNTIFTCTRVEHTHPNPHYIALDSAFF